MEQFRWTDSLGLWTGREPRRYSEPINMAATRRNDHHARTDPNEAGEDLQTDSEGGNDPPEFDLGGEG